MRKNLGSGALEELGLTKGEADAYLALLELGESTAPDVARESGLQKSAAYFCLERLVKKGLASQLMEGNVRVFQPAPVSSMLDLVSEKERVLKQAKKTLAELSKKIAPREARPAVAKVFEGWRGTRAAFGEFLGGGHAGEYVVFSVSIPEDVFPRFRRFIKNIHGKRVEKGIRARLLVSEDLRKTIGRDRQKEPRTKVRFVPREFSTPAVLNIFGNYTLVIIWAEEPYALLLESRAAADSFRNYFELLWKIAID